MSRNYSEINNEIRNTGFFSEYLPPCFTLDTNAFLTIPPKKCDTIAPYCFTMSRYNGSDSRRNIYIPEIGAYAVVHTYIKQNNILEDIIELTENNSHSFSPILGKDDSIMRHEQAYKGEPVETESVQSTYIDNVVKKLISAQGAKKILKLDISNCFSSFYCHMIPAIMLGLEQEENEYKLCSTNPQAVSDTYRRYSQLDAVIRRQNLNRTNGLLVGPLSSKILAEGLLTQIDRELEASNLKFSRYVDDYEVYLYDDNEKYVESVFTKILGKYSFNLNSEKTEIVSFPYYVAENLDRIIESYSNQATLDDTDLMGLFNQFLQLESNGTKGAIRYLLKSIEKKPINAKKPDLFKSYILTILSNNERALTKACSLLLNSNTQLTLSDSDTALLVSMLSHHLAEGHDLEVIWLVYVLVECNKLAIGHPIIESILNSNNELAKMILFRKALLTEDQKDILKEMASSWILLYELFASDTISQEVIVNRLNLNHNLEMYQKMRINNVHFCYSNGTRD